MCIRVELQMGVLLKKGKHVFNLDWNCILKVNKSGKGHFLSRKENQTKLGQKGSDPDYLIQMKIYVYFK